MIRPMPAMQSCVSMAIESAARSRRDLQAGLDLLLVGLDVFLELARKEFAHLGVEPVDIGHQRQQPHQQQQQDG